MLHAVNEKNSDAMFNKSFKFVRLFTENLV